MLKNVDGKIVCLTTFATRIFTFAENVRRVVVDPVNFGEQCGHGASVFVGGHVPFFLGTSSYRAFEELAACLRVGCGSQEIMEITTVPFLRSTLGLTSASSCSGVPPSTAALEFKGKTWFRIYQFMAILMRKLISNHRI